MVGETIALNSVQKLPTDAINVRRTVSPFTFYECPVGFKAVVKGTALVDNFGAGTTVSLKGAGVFIAQWIFTSCVVGNFDVKKLCLGTQFKFEIQLDAGDIVEYIQNSGTNASIDFTATVQETPI